MPYPRKYQDRRETCVSMEKVEGQIAHDLKIQFNEAFRIGLHAMIEARLNEPDKYPVTPQMVDAYLEIKNRNLTDLKNHVSAMNVMKRESDVVKSVSANQDEHIRVFDTIEEKYRDITRKQMKSWYDEVPLLRDEEGNTLWNQDMAVA